MEAKHIQDIMEAYASLYAQPEQEVLSEEVISEEVLEEKKKIATGSGKKAMPSKKERSKLAKRARAGEDIGKPGKGFEMVAKKAAKQYGSKEAGERVAAAAMFRNEEVETDLFDVILEYLVAEGYADTNKAALAIMANMSEEWKKEIVDACELQEKLKPGTKRVSFSTGRDESHNQAMTETNPRTGRQRGTSPELKAIGAHAQARTAQRAAENRGDTAAAQRNKERRDRIATVVYNKTNRIIDRADND